MRESIAKSSYNRLLTNSNSAIFMYWHAANRVSNQMYLSKSKILFLIDLIHQLRVGHTSSICLDSVTNLPQCLSS